MRKLLLSGLLAFFASCAWSQTTNSPTSTSVLSKNYPVFEVKAYGPAGIGNDDTSAIVAADAAALAAGGGIVHFGPSANPYKVSSISIPSGVHWVLEGSLTATSSFNDGGAIVQIKVPVGSNIVGVNWPTLKAANSTNAQATLRLLGSNVVSGLILDGNGANNTVPINAYIATIGNQGAQNDITGNRFINSPEFAIVGSGGTVGLRVRDNSFLNALGEAVHIGNYGNGAPGSGGKNINITNNYIEAASPTIDAFVINFSQVSDSVISGNQMILTGAHDVNAMALRDPQNITVNGNYVSGGTAESINLFVQDRGGAVVRNNVVTGNVVVNAGVIAFGLHDSTGGGAVVAGNTITGNTVIDANFRNIRVPNYDCGIRVTGLGAVGNNVSNNTFISTLTGQSPARRGFNHGACFDNLSPGAANISTGNVFTVADPSGPPNSDFRNLSSAGVSLSTNRGVTKALGSQVADPVFGSLQFASVAACESNFGITALNVGGTTTNTAQSCLPANSIIDAVVYRVTTSITKAASFTIGDSTTAARFCSTQSSLTEGTTGICFVQADQTGAAGPRQVAGTTVRVTTNANPGAGAIRLIVYFHTWTPPTR
jgi:hypothetical protein